MAFDPSTASSKILKIDHSKIDASLTNFPIAIDLDTHVADLITALGTNKLKLAVGNTAGTTQYYVEIECWETGNHVIHTKIPSISATTDTEFKVFWDNSQDDNSPYVGVTNSTPAESVWDSDFLAVYLMSQDPTGTAPQILDSTGNGNDLTVNGSISSVAGSIGKALSFNGSTDYLKATSLDFSSLNSVRTLQTLFIWDDIGSGGNDHISYIDSASYDDTFARYSNHSKLTVGPSGYTSEGSLATPEEEWFIATERRASGLNETFINESKDSVTDNHPDSSMASVTFTIGSDQSGSKLSEMRMAVYHVSSVGRSDAWVKATAANLKDEILAADVVTIIVDILKPKLKHIFNPFPFLGGV